MVRNFVNSFQFRLRADFLGKLKLRPGLPATLSFEERRSELAFYQLLLRRAMEEEVCPQVETVVDVGCRNWSYVDALALFFPNAEITGVEVDGWRRYWNLYRRIDQAAAYANELKNEQKLVRALSIDFRQLQLESNLGQVAFTYFFPFVSENPCLGWGLPARYSDFSSLLRHSLQLFGSQKIRAPWIWISSHQGEWEADIAREAYLKLNFDWTEKQISPHEVSGIWPSRFPTVLFKARFAIATV